MYSAVLEQLQEDLAFRRNNEARIVNKMGRLNSSNVKPTLPVLRMKYTAAAYLVNSTVRLELARLWPYFHGHDLLTMRAVPV